jgi:hypothetical protein
VALKAAYYHSTKDHFILFWDTRDRSPIKEYWNIPRSWLEI